MTIIIDGTTGISPNLAVTGALTVTGGVDKLTSATGVVSVAAATAPSVGQVLMATSGTVATWQTPSSGPTATATTLGVVYGRPTSNSTVTAYGYNAGASLTTGGYATCIGEIAGQSNTTGDQITCVGNGALKSNTTGDWNTAVGTSALYANVSGIECTAVGRSALRFSTGDYNTAIGSMSLYTNTSGTKNIAVGGYALNANTTGGSNTAVGFQALYTNNTNNNTAVGYKAITLATGNGNTAVGNLSGSSIGAGVRNTSLGDQSNNNGTTGNDNICVGYSTALGAAGDSNELVIGTAGGSTLTGKGSTTGYISPGGGGVYQGNNSLSWSVTSDQRLKKNIVDNNVGLEKITAIQVRNFEYRLPEEVDAELKPTDAIKKEGVQLGVIAQELQAVLPECVKTESTGVMSVNADNLTWYLVNAIKELKAEFEAYKLTHP